MKPFVKRIAALLSAGALALGLAACSPAQEGPAATPSPTPGAPSPVPTQSAAPKDSALRLGVMYSTDIVPLAVMLEQGLDAQNGFTLDMQVFQSAKDRDAALQAGELDGVFTDLVGMCIYANAGLDLKITSVTDGDYVLLAAPGSGIASLTQAAGQYIAISENTLIEYALDYLLEESGFADDYLAKEVVPRIPDRLEMLRSGQTALGLLPDPFSTLAGESGAVRLCSANEYGLYPAVMAFTQDSIVEKESLLASFYAAYDQAVDYVNSTPISEFEDVVIQRCGFPEELAGRITLPVFRTHALPTEAEIQDAIDWAAEKGLCAADLQAGQLIGSLN